LPLPVIESLGYWVIKLLRAKKAQGSKFKASAYAKALADRQSSKLKGFRAEFAQLYQKSDTATTFPNGK
jgi:hypothetical protein